MEIETCVHVLIHNLSRCRDSNPESPAPKAGMLAVTPHLDNKSDCSIFYENGQEKAQYVQSFFLMKDYNNPENLSNVITQK